MNIHLSGGMSMPLSSKQRRFVQEYMVDHNASRAARQAGYGEKSAKVTGCRLLTNANVAEAIRAEEKATALRLELRRDRPPSTVHGFRRFCPRSIQASRGRFEEPQPGRGQRSGLLDTALVCRFSDAVVPSRTMRAPPPLRYKIERTTACS